MLSSRTISAICLVLMVSALVGVAIVLPGHGRLLPPCPFHALTGLFCPGCGVTRMFYHLARGEVWLSFRQNPLAFVALPLVLGALIKRVLPAAWQARWRSPRFRSPMWSYAILAVVVIYAIVRNIPYWPACTLAPGGC